MTGGNNPTVSGIVPPQYDAILPVRVAASVVLRFGRSPDRAIWTLLSLRHSYTHLPDLWEFPGGKIEGDEAPRDCALRELHEETGIRAEYMAPLFAVVERYPERTVEIEFHVCRYLDGVPAPLGCQAVRWVRPENVETYALPAASRGVVSALEADGWLDGRLLG